MGVSLRVWGRGVFGGGGGVVLGEGGEKAEILDFFIELGGWIVWGWRGRDDIFIDVGHLLNCCQVVRLCCWECFRGGSRPLSFFDLN